ncbi:Hsp33 family molecular chaperone HslO [Ottowia sp. SB7-C50]|uniref:Hsp33 family molecular chaperone HslO n=1 Tax=Ottowia sp. SB7-C50 TaxID=3081231 RepID=UPI0029532730|nr:Hsp33 family molecular chaperone HslO [Ottowia sp. SB7-C50]WOP16679.1 Hsp33 family molecular chaperone HslO [Ottowia sp. SB7-C50]
MSELHKFIFDGLPVRGQLVRLTDAWQEVLRRRAANTQTGAYPPPVAEMLGEMAAAAVLMQGNIKFDGALIMQIFGDGPVKVAVAEVQSDLRLRATASVVGAVTPGMRLPEMVDAQGKGRCAITLDPQNRQEGQQPYQGVVPLADEGGAPLMDLAAVVEHYMRQSEQLDTTLVLAADEQVAAGLLIQRLPVQGQDNLSQSSVAREDDAREAAEDDYQRIAILAKSLKRDELLGLDADTILRRLFWEESLMRFEPQAGAQGPRFACSCSRERVGAMLKGLGQHEAEDILKEQGQIEVGCDFCGQQERFDAVDVGRLFTPAAQQLPQPGSVQ